MPALDATQTIIKSEGGVYVAPLATGVPTDLSALAPAWERLGYIEEDSLSIPGLEGETTRYRAWDVGTAIRSKVEAGDASVELGLLQWTQQNLVRYFPGSMIDGVSGNVQVPATPGNGAEVEGLVVVADGANSVGFWFAKVQARPNGPLEFPDDAMAPIPLALDILAPTSGSLIEIIDAFVDA